MNNQPSNQSQDRSVPVYILSGFLGSGKTTLLVQLLEHWKKQGLRPAVIMNELGEVNLDGQVVDESVPMAEMLGGCICCTVRGDLGLQLSELIQTESPDVIIIEATGAANPMEILDGVTETSLYMRLELKSLITVVDAAHLWGLHAEQKGKTFRLMQDQIRCASVLLLNKTDRVNDRELEELQQLLAKWNAYAPVIGTVKCQVDMDMLLRAGTGVQSPSRSLTGNEPDSDHGSADSHVHTAECALHGCSHGHDKHDHAGHRHEAHASHEHVMVYTHYFTKPVNSEAFERFVANLPRDVYRAKGILTFSDTASRFWFQYAYQESDYMKINPQGQVPNVAVFIGEHFEQGAIREQLLALEGTAE
ncbi:GTP-binding protein [Paenibacillus sp. FSL W8-0426]|uniref:CobW family GTP-binding protein n=1 Tax=Paenibacillus sp. FSL W8-0426 TaxID=2921714 RepID=UPI0030DCF383